MGFFTPDTKEDALKQIERINQEMRAISASIHLNYNQIDGRNRSEVSSHYNNVIRYSSKYNRIKNNLSFYDKVALEATRVNAWNGEVVGVFTWEVYLNNVMDKLCHDINY